MNSLEQNCPDPKNLSNIFFRFKSGKQAWNTAKAFKNKLKILEKSNNKLI